MDVRLPSGTVIRNVPEGTSQADLRSKLLANGYDESIFSNVSKEAQPEIAPDKYPTLAAAADVPLSFGRGAVTGVKMIADAFGADNPVSKTLSSVDTTLEALMSAQSKRDAQEVSRIMNEAKDKGVWDQVKAGLNAFSVAPVDLLTNAFGTAAPTVVAGLLAAAAAPEIAVGTAVGIGVGAVSGAGTIKDRIYTDVKRALTDQGVAPEKADAAAQEAQAYGGKNLDQIMLGALFGAGASVTGAEAALVKGLSSKILGNAAKEAATAVEEKAAKGIGGRLVEGAIKEAVPEAAQEAQEQVASNIAQQREGVDVPTFQGAGTSAALAGTIGAIMGGGLNVATTSGPRTVDKEAENAVLLKALETNRRAMDDENFLAFANTLRDRVPVLGEILDSNVPRATKLSLIQSRIAEANIGGNQEQIDVGGPRGLPAPEIQKSENLRQVLNNTMDIADRAGVPLGDLTVNQGPEGWRIVSPDSKIMSDPMPLGSEREANVVLEGIRRTHDERQTERYRAESDEYRRDLDKQMTAATVAAARESMTPFEPISLDEIYEYDPALFNKIYDSRLKDKSVATKEDAQAPVTIDEMRKRGAKRDDINHFAIQQKPFTAGTGGLRPGIEDELYGVGVKPTEPKPMAKTEEELARQKYATVTPVDVTPEQVRDIEEEEAAPSPSQEAQDLRDAYTRLRRAGYTDEQIGGLTKEQFYNALVEGDGAEFSRSKEDRKSEKERKKIYALYDQIEAGRDRRENGVTAPVKPLRSALAPELTDEEIADARKIIEDRVAKYEAAGKQGAAIGKGVRDAIANSDFTPNQLLQAFQVADISARLLGKTDADPHALEFVQRIATPFGDTAGGARIAPSENLQGIIKMALDKTYDPNSTTAHESFHVLQDLFAAYDKAGAKIINDAFKGATSFDGIDANLLRKLKSLRDPDTGNSVYTTLKENVEDKGLLEDYDQATREREMQAYVFGYMDNAITNGNQNMGGLGAAFVRFLNYYRQFKARVGNYFKGLGYQTAEDVLGATSRGKRQAGLGVEGELVRKALPGESEEFSRARRDGGEQVSTNLNDRDPANRAYGLYPYLRSVATKVFDHPKMIMGTMNPGNAAKQIAALDEIRRRYPNPLQSAAKFAEMLSYAFGNAVKDGTVPLVPYNAIRLANEKDVVKNQIGGLSEGQIHMAEDGFRLGARFKRLYQSGQMKPEHTAKMILWGILSRGVSPFVQESAFMDIVTDRGNKAGVGHFIQAALDGRFNMADYLEWTSYVMPDESPGNGTTHNLNAFGKTLVKLAEKLEDGRTVLETLHDAIKDYNNTGPQVRRVFHTINNSMGINNKVLSFVLLVTGRNDVLVLDRVQMRNLFNDGRFDDYNMYDGEKSKRTVQKRSGEESEEDAADRGTSIAPLGNGAIGLLYYEALERGLISSIRTAYNELNRGNGSAGQYHWESWVVSSAQEVDHGSIEGILKDAEGVVDPYFGVTTREGKFDTFNSGMIYGHDKEGNPYTELTDGLGNFYRFDPESAKAVLNRISKSSNGVVPKGFKVSQNETGPWFNNPEVNQARLSQLLSQAGTLVRGNASPFSQANTDVNRPVLRTTGADQSTARGGAGEVEFSRAAALTGDSVEEFKTWWKKSQAVDENGQPKTYYTGKATTRLDKDGKPFKTFGRAGSGALVDAMGVPMRGVEGPYYFSPEPPFASQFAMRRLSKNDFKEKRADQAAEGGRMIPAFLSVQNPFDYDNQDHVDLLFQDPMLKEAILRNNVYKAMIEMGWWKELEKRVVQLAIRRAGFDGFYLMEQLPEFDDNNKPTGNKIVSKNLAVYKANQIKSIFNQFLPGTAVSREFSRAIAATKQEKEAEANSTRYFQVWDKAREFFNPLALVNNLPQFLSFRNVTTGTITMSEQYARKMADKIAKGSVEERQAVYKFMTTKAGDSSLIKDPEIRKAAIEAKKAINDYAKLMVARKEMTQESFDNYYDRYLPRIYLLYEATNRGMKTPMGGTSVREYLDKRDEELSEEYRKVLGEIKDPSYLTYIALSRPARDIAMSDYLNNLFTFGGDPKNQWIAPQSIVEYDGKKYTPYDLQHMADDLDSAAEIAKNLSEDQAKAMGKEASKMRRVALAAQGDLKYKLDEIRARGYEQIPTRRQYGVLAGAVVQKGIYQDLVGTFIPVGKDNPSLIERLIGDEHSAVQKANALWKLGKTTLNPPTQVVNFVSNAISLNLFGGVPIHKFPYLFKKTMNEIMKNGSMYQEAQKFGLTGGTMSKVELDRAFIRMQRYQAKVGGEGNLVNMFATSRAIGSAFIEKAGDAYQFSESLFKMMMYIHSVETDKMKPSDAVNAANEIMFDYSLVNNNIRWLRNAPLGLPFITYYYKVLPKIIETLYKHPQRFIPYIALAYALPAMTMAAFDLDDDELEKLRLSAQDYVRDSGTLFFLPFRDSKGNIQFVDVGKYLPFSSLLSPFITAFKYGNYTKAAFELTRPITPSGPVITTIAALATGNDPFTNKPIMDPRDTNKAQALSLFSYIFNQAMPPVIGMDFNNFEKSSGALPRVYNSLFVDGTGVDKRGMPKPELLESAARILGLNITPLKADVQRLQNINYMASQINKTRSLMAQTAADQSLMPDRKREKNRELVEKVKEQVLEMQKYANDTANIGQITKKIKEAP